MQLFNAVCVGREGRGKRKTDQKEREKEMVGKKGKEGTRTIKKMT